MRIALSVLLLLLFVPTWSQDGRLMLLKPGGGMRAAPVMLDPAHPARRRVGGLTWLGGVRLTGRDAAFGGFSAIAAKADRLTLLSDGGSLVQFRIDRRLGIGGLRFGTLPGGPGTGWRKNERDSESMAIDPARGTIWVGFEAVNGIWRYAPGFASAGKGIRPPAMRHWDSNGGAESMVRLPDGRFLVLSETSRWPHGRGRAGIVFRGDPVEAPRAGFRFSYIPPPGFDPSDAAVLPDGRLLVLNRRFALPFAFSAKLTIVDLRDIRPGARITGREIATLAAPLIHDNFEGLAVSQEGGATILWIVSDDNQSLLQQSLLLKFRLEPDSSTPR